MPPAEPPIFRTYTNALTINNALVMPTYDDYVALNDEARRIFETALPEDTVIETVNADLVIEVGGAVHCTTMQLSTLPTNWKRSESNTPDVVAWPEGAIGNRPNLKWSAGETISSTLDNRWAPSTNVGTIEIGVMIEHRAPESVIVRVHHDGRAVELPINNDASPINERRFITNEFQDTAASGEWRIEIESERFNFSGALLEWWIRAQ